MRKRISLVTLPVLLCLLLTSCGGTKDTSREAKNMSAQIEENGAEADEREFSNVDVDVAYDSARAYYRELSMNLEEIDHNEEMDAAEYYVSTNLDKYGEDNVMMFDAVAEEEPDTIRHIILVRENADSEWSVECEVLEEG